MRITAVVLHDVSKPYSIEAVELHTPWRGEVPIMSEIKRAYEDIETDAVGRAVLAL